MCGSGVVDANEVGGVSVVLLQSLSYGYGEAETLVAVCLCLGAEHVVGHVAQAVGETVVSGDVYLCPVEEGDERNPDPRKPIVLFGSLVAGVGEVEDIVLLLRIEHEGVLVGVLHGVEELVAHPLAHLREAFLPFAHLVVGRLKLVSQDAQRLRQVFLFQHAVGRGGVKKQHRHDAERAEEGFPCCV